MSDFADFFNIKPSTEKIVALYQNHPVSQQQFIADISALVIQLNQQTQTSWCLFHLQAYPFAVALFALALAKKNIVIPGNNTPDTIDALSRHCDAYLGDVPNSTVELERVILSDTSTVNTSTFKLDALDSNAVKITVFTSGSSGQAKAIEKNLTQFEAESLALEQSFNQQLSNKEGQALVIATVSHQHIYGLIFRIFWPLLTNRIFTSEQILDNALVLRTIRESARPIIWVASPAHLKRLSTTEHTDSNKLLAVFSSGGPLSIDAANTCQQQLLQNPIEVFGSSETGGIAWRKQSINPLWKPLPDVLIATSDNGALKVKSAHINSQHWYQCDDAVLIHNNGQFELQGRLDRIVKLEEKRLSLVELETQINAIDLVVDSYCLVLNPEAQKRQRDILACACQLTPQGKDTLSQLGKFEFIKHLKQQLRNHFELSLIPKKWRFVASIPSNAQAKIDTATINQLFTS